LSDTNHRLPRPAEDQHSARDGATIIEYFDRLSLGKPQHLPGVARLHGIERHVADAKNGDVQTPKHMRKLSVGMVL
jgi:hypothetical protein